MKIFYSFYSQLPVMPDLVIFLERSPIFNAPEELKTNFFYSLNFKDYAPPRNKVETVTALSRNTLAQVINIIKLAELEEATDDGEEDEEEDE
jgi:hypothetical protein